MNGTVITNLCIHFESKADNGDEATDVTKCHTICSSLLGCAGFISPNNREDLLSQLSDRLKDYCNNSGTDKNTFSVVPYLAVFCSWGMQQEVAKVLSSSVNSVFTDEQTTDSSLQFSPVPSTRGKRKQSSNNKKEGSIIPQFPGEMGLQIIAQILRGRDSSSLAIRNALIASEDSTVEISDSLERATKAAEHYIKGLVSASCKKAVVPKKSNLIDFFVNDIRIRHFTEMKVLSLSSLYPLVRPLEGLYCTRKRPNVILSPLTPRLIHC